MGKEDDRHLWPQMFRAIREIRPRYVVGENVRGLLNWSEGLVLEEVYADLESEGYEVQTFVLPAVGINAPHRRDRVYIIAHANSDAGRSGSSEGGRTECEASGNGESSIHIGSQSNGNEGNATKSSRVIKQGGPSETWDGFPIKSPLCSGDYGLPTELDGLTFPKWRKESIMGYGNAIVPQIAYRIFATIDEIESQKS
jgi:DNA (cytosine-5)-methyltransferase 1